MLKKLITLALISSVALAAPSAESPAKKQIADKAKKAADAAQKTKDAAKTEAIKRGYRQAKKENKDGSTGQDKRRKVTPPPKGNKPKSNSKGTGERKGKSAGPPSREFCIQQFNTKEFMYTHTDAEGNKNIALTPKDKAGEIDLKWVWKKAKAEHNSLYGYLENSKRQLGVIGSIDDPEAWLTWNEEISNEMINWFHVEPKTRRINQAHGLRLTSHGSIVSLKKENRTEQEKLNENQEFVAVDCETGVLLDSKFQKPMISKRGGKDTRTESQKTNSRRDHERSQAKKARKEKNKVKEDL